MEEGDVVNSLMSTKTSTKIISYKEVLAQVLMYQGCKQILDLPSHRTNKMFIMDISFRLQPKCFFFVNTLRRNKAYGIEQEEQKKGSKRLDPLTVTERQKK
eukprot:TRINITY_DN10344_c0_g1_i1.p2 TRINITY_DN10344_c0_g1~~TRINITY_DN10344_c0_g1_i1.p2  ORF type:complete len:101 (+),score=0.86 TRINITY_DN10344_c0_g1_i1:166-468(+)